MKRIFLITFLILFLPLGAMAEKIKVFHNQKEVPVKTRNIDGEIFVSLSDLAKILSLDIFFEPARSRLEIQTTEAELSLTPGKEAVEKGFTGQVLLQAENKLEFPVKNVEVKLYQSKQEVTDEIALSMFKNMALQKNNNYEQVFGLVRHDRTDTSGRFYLQPVPPGTYEITAIYYFNGGKRGRFWRKKIIVKDDNLSEVLLNWQNSYQFEI
ncbi:MAG: hypothetical protein ACLFQV_08445 [Vulcanimicrobiota bacterium]